MPRLTAIDPANAPAKSQPLLKAVQAKLGITPNMMRTMAASPDVLGAYLAFSGALAHGELSARLREQIALLTAELNDCDYCLAAHTVIGKGAGLSADDALAARRGQATDPGSAAALTLARRIIETGGEISDDEVASARRAGLTDAQIAEIIAAVALNIFTNLFNKVADTEVDFPAAEPLAVHA